MDSSGLCKLLRCDVCRENISCSGKCLCEEDITMSLQTVAHQHFYKSQLQEIIKCCINAGVPSPSQFPKNVSYEVRVEGDDKRIYTVHSLGPRNMVQIKLDTQYFSSYKKENGRHVEDIQHREKDINVGHSGSGGGDRPCQAEGLCDEHTNSVEIEGEGKGGEISVNSGPPYILPLRVTFYTSLYSLLQIFSQSLDWDCLLQELETNTAELAWHFYVRETSTHGDLQVGSSGEDDGVGEIERSYGSALPQLDKKYLNGEEAWCCICRNSNLELGERKYPLLLPCGHGYHPHCIAKWLGAKSTCPLCRHVLPECP
ncbi:hypothetical protein KI387_039222 [Taxus chinensis]|uniref:RING-type domain-containing protein n=1 Tax=Taxus chinensis TaxID=29808 RepID=A0AA38CFK2_TAXCH|nr:hypothetical protein KI387_039222 [Taxus chinensis]